MKLKRQVETNTRRMRMLMIMVEQDIRRRSQNAQDIDDWMEKLSPFIHEDVFVTGIYSAKMAAIISKIASAVTISSLPKGMNQSVTKGIISECCYTYVRGATREMQTEMQKFAIECYNNKMTAVEISDALGKRFSDLTKARCQAIARTETMRASNLANLVQARNRGATGYTVFCNPGACTHCINEYGKHENTVYDINDTVNFPPLHPNCRCTPAFIY